MHRDVGKIIIVVIGAIFLSVVAGVLFPSGTEISSNGKPLEIIELEVEEAVVSRHRSRVATPSHRKTTVANRGYHRFYTKPVTIFHGHRLCNGLRAPMLN